LAAHLQGSALALVLFDVCEEIDVETLKTISGARRSEPPLKSGPAAYVRFERPPVVDTIEPLVLTSGERLEGQIKYYDYGVVSVIYQMPLSCDWNSLVQLANRWITTAEFEQHAQEAVKRKLPSAAPTLVKPYSEWLKEDYLIFQLHEVAGITSGAELVSQHGKLIAQIVRGEVVPLSKTEEAEILQSNISYYPQDVTVIGWNAALVFDTPSGAETAIQLLEYANSQLLEFRHYDELLTRELARVYRHLDEKTSLWRRWRLGAAATQLQQLLVDVTELTERVDNSIKFLSDMFDARLYRLAASKVGVPDYKNLVSAKLKTAGDLYRYMVDEFHQSRAFILELTVVIILIIELLSVFHIGL
jgi:hypothetical protein